LFTGIPNAYTKKENFELLNLSAVCGFYVKLHALCCKYDQKLSGYALCLYVKLKQKLNQNSHTAKNVQNKTEYGF